MGHRRLIATLAMLRGIRYDFRFWPMLSKKGGGSFRCYLADTLWASWADWPAGAAPALVSTPTQLSPTQLTQRRDLAA